MTAATDNTAVRRALRTLARRVPVPGFFALVIDPIDRRLGATGEAFDVNVDGFTMRVDLRDYNQRRIYYHAHEPGEAALLRKLLRPGDTVIDVGANVGFFTLLAATAVGPTGTVHAVEPVPANRATLEENLRANAIENVSVVAAAAGATAGEVTLGIPDGIDADRGETSAMYTQGGARNVVTAQVVALDDYVSRHVPQRPALVKIDVEGMEPHVLEGMQRTLAQSPPATLMVEANRDRLADHGFGLDDVAEPLRAAGYRLARVDAFGRLRPLRPERDRRRPIFNLVARRTATS